MKFKAHDQYRRKKLEEELTKMEYSLKVKSRGHYIASEFYGRWNIRLQYVSYITGTLGALGGVFSKLAWKTIAQNYPRLAPVTGAIAATMSLFAVLVNRHCPRYSPSFLHEVHFMAGRDCKHLQRRVRFFARTDVWNMDIPWVTLAARYEILLEVRKEAQHSVLCEDWAYQEALKRIETKKKRTKRHKDNQDAKNDGRLGKYQ